MQRPALSDNPRPLPPLPLLFSSSSVAGNVRLLEKGQGAEWGPELVLGVCGLNRALQKGQGVKVEVKGTGYFNVILRKRAFAASLEKVISPWATINVYWQEKECSAHLRKGPTKV